MTKEQFDEFIAVYDLYYFDGLIEITHADGSVNKGVWITTLPSLDVSADSKFPGKPEQEVFYLFESDSYAVWKVNQIMALKCIQQEYLKSIPSQLKGIAR